MTLTPTERLIVEELAADGCSNYVIAQRVGLSERTVRWYLNSIMRKTGTYNRTQVVLWWLRSAH